MERLNPKSPAEFEQMKEEEAFLSATAMELLLVARLSRTITDRK